MHPDLFLVVYRQQERELVHRLEHARSQAARGDDATGRRTTTTLGHLGALGSRAARAARRRH